MMPWIGAVFILLGFVILARVLGLVRKSKEVTSLAHQSLGVVRSKDLSDEEKEKALRKTAGRLFLLAVLLSAGGAAALMVPIGLLWLAEQIGWISLDAVLHVTVSPAFIIGSCAAALLAYFAVRRLTTGENNYSPLDRMLHRLAFKTYRVQTAIADVEDGMFGKKLQEISSQRPVFITALPRAGTTLLLECFAHSARFACHRYRDMPFVLIPCMWGRFSRFFQQEGASRERAHGDGMLIDFDSPEALEEVLWKTFWAKHYAEDRIRPWTSDERDEEFETFFRNHMRKIILLRDGSGRYVSKNNLNIARVRLLRTLFPDATILVPFRHPLQHATSLLNQHRNFLEIHEGDRFAKDYMRAIGHFDFGENLRPVDFDGWYEKRECRDAASLGFWLEYWISAYGHLKRHTDLIHFVSYESFCGNAERSLRLLADAVECEKRDALLAGKERVRAVKLREVDAAGVPGALITEADELHGELKGMALF